MVISLSLQVSAVERVEAQSEEGRGHEQGHAQPPNPDVHQAVAPAARAGRATWRVTLSSEMRMRSANKM